MKPETSTAGLITRERNEEVEVMEGTLVVVDEGAKAANLFFQ